MIYRLADGNIIVADEEYINDNYPTAVHIASNTLPEGARAELTKSEFRGLFTVEEKIEIELASLDDPSAAIEHRRAQAALRVYLADVEAVEFVDLASSLVAMGLGAMVQIGIITQERAGEIVSTEA